MIKADWKFGIHLDGHRKSLGIYDAQILQNRQRTCCIVSNTSFLCVKTVSLPYAWHFPTVSMLYLGIIAGDLISKVSFRFSPYFVRDYGDYIHNTKLEMHRESPSSSLMPHAIYFLSA